MQHVIYLSMFILLYLHICTFIHPFTYHFIKYTCLINLCEPVCRPLYWTDFCRPCCDPVPHPGPPLWIHVPFYEPVCDLIYSSTNLCTCLSTLFSY